MASAPTATRTHTDQAPAFHHADTGTPEADWEYRFGQFPVPSFALPASGSLLVIAPHPDDETLGTGGLIATANALGWSTRVLLLTDGEHGGGDPTATAAVRTAEFAAALSALGCEQGSSSRANLGDGNLTNCEARLHSTITAALHGVTLCLAPFDRDGHPDHEAAGRITRLACQAAGVPFRTYPVWMWHWQSPARANLDGAYALPLDAAARAAKRNAIAAYTTQTTGLDPIVGPHVLAHFLRPFEVLLP